MNSKIKPSNAEMEYLTAPFKVSRIALGTWASGGWMWGGTDEAESIRTVHEAIDRGITLIDTAPAYGFAIAIVGYWCFILGIGILSVVVRLKHR